MIICVFVYKYNIEFIIVQFLIVLKIIENFLHKSRMLTYFVFNDSDVISKIVSVKYAIMLNISN